MKLSGLAVIFIALALAAGVAFLINDWLDTQQARVTKTEAELRAERERLQVEIDRLAEEQARLEEERGRVPEPETVSVLVAARDLPVGTRINRDDVGVRQMLPAERPGDAFTQPGEVLDNLVIREIEAGDLLLPTRLSKETRLSVTSLISEGKRAITIDVDRDSDQLKLIEPGSRVDVLVVSDSSRDAVILRRLENIDVLAVGQKIERNQEDVIDSAASSITLEVDRDQADFLTRAIDIDNNKIKLLLRSQYENSESEKIAAVKPVWNIRQGYRAITINVDEASGQLNLIERDSRVDVIITPQETQRVLVKGSGAEGSAPDSLSSGLGLSGNSFVFQDVRVLSVGQNLGSDQAVWIDELSVTLEIPRDEAAYFAQLVSSDENIVKLLLRNESDRWELETKVMTLIRGTEQCVTTPGQDCR